MNSTQKALDEIARKAGGYSALGREFGGISGWAIQKWYRSGVVPAERVPALVDLGAMYGIQVKPWAVRPDVYPVRWFARE